MTMAPERPAPNGSAPVVNEDDVVPHAVQQKIADERKPHAADED